MTRSLGRSILSMVVAAAVVGPPARAQVTAGQVDTFESGTTQNWAIGVGPGLGGGSPPSAALPTVALGGPGGAADHYLQLHSLGTPGAGGRLAVINYAGQWVGNYLGAGIAGIRMDANNFGDTDLALRLLFENPALPPAPAPPTDEAASALPLLLPAHSG